jgi:hypothetical protein
MEFVSYDHIRMLAEVLTLRKYAVSPQTWHIPLLRKLRSWLRPVVESPLLRRGSSQGDS